LRKTTARETSTLLNPSYQATKANTVQARDRYSRLNQSIGSIRPMVVSPGSVISAKGKSSSVPMPMATVVDTRGEKSRRVILPRRE